MSRTIIITGAGRGIGRAITLITAKYFLERYETVNMALISRSDEKSLLSVCASLNELGVNTCHFIGDIADPVFLEDVVSLSARTFGSIDILINNAGISHIGLLQDMSFYDMQNLVNVNLTAAMKLSALCVPYLLRSQSSPRIINISSVWGNVGASCEAVYSATKGGLNSFTKALAKELAPNAIPVNAVSCGLIDTSMNAHLSEEEMCALYDEIPAGRAGSPEEVAEIVCTLLTATPYLTGQIITLDGAWT